MKATTILGIVAIIAAIGAVASVQLVLMATPAHAQCFHHDCDDSHGQSYHDSNGDFHSGRTA